MQTEVLHSEADGTVLCADEPSAPSHEEVSKALKASAAAAEHEHVQKMLLELERSRAAMEAALREMETSIAAKELTTDLPQAEEEAAAKEQFVRERVARARAAKAASLAELAPDEEVPAAKHRIERNENWDALEARRADYEERLLSAIAKASTAEEEQDLKARLDRVQQQKGKVAEAKARMDAALARLEEQDLERGANSQALARAKAARARREAVAKQSLAETPPAVEQSRLLAAEALLAHTHAKIQAAISQAKAAESGEDGAISYLAASAVRPDLTEAYASLQEADLAIKRLEVQENMAAMDAALDDLDAVEEERARSRMHDAGAAMNAALQQLQGVERARADVATAQAAMDVALEQLADVERAANSGALARAKAARKRREDIAATAN